MTSMELSTKIVNLMTPGAGVLVFWQVNRNNDKGMVYQFYDPGNGFLC